MKKYTINPLFADLRQRAKKAGQAPGTLTLSDEKQDKKTFITVTTFNEQYCQVATGTQLKECLSEQTTPGITWVNIEGFNNLELMDELKNRFSIHPLTIEDILNANQRPKVEEFDGYLFLTLKMLRFSSLESALSIEQVAIVFGEHFVLSFLESKSSIFDTIRTKLQSTTTQRLRQQKSDYLTYRLLDAIVDDYFVILENLGEEIESIESKIISSPTPHNSRVIYRLKHQMLLLRKAIWPMREMISHLLYEEDSIITKFTRVYLRDLYDHAMQAIDTIETFREMLSSMLDMYLSGLTMRMNEIVKTLTIITTIFIPITALASIYGMNLPDIPLMKSSKGFLIVSVTMITSIVGMVLYFRKKRWI